jgi:hypothetical protein
VEVIERVMRRRAEVAGVYMAKGPCAGVKWRGVVGVRLPSHTSPANKHERLANHLVN